MLRGIKKWVLPLFYFMPVISFMYISVELLAERSSSLAAMEMAYSLHRKQHNNLLKDSAQPDEVMPGDLPRQRQEDFNKFLEGVFRDGQADLVDGVNQNLLADVQFQDKLNRFRKHREGLVLQDVLGKEKQFEVVDGEVGKWGDPHVEKKNVVGMVAGQREKEGEEREEGVTFPLYVEEWGPDLPGEGGKPVKINATALTAEEKRRYHKGWADNSFNQYASDLISVHRSLPDNNPPECVEQRKEYSSHLPEVSVIIIFHNEAWSVLLRSVHSVLSRTPSHLLRQIILVDDLSTMDHLKRPLEVYWRREPKVSIVRAPRRVGLTQARLLGYRVATAEVLVFLDSHIECFPGWMEPLLHRVQETPSIAVFPLIDVIWTDNFDTLQTIGVYAVGFFRWRDLTFQWGFQSKFKEQSRANFIRCVVVVPRK